MIDLHLHTNASDGRCTPAQLVARAREAALTVISVTDHDTFAALPEVEPLAASAGIRLVTGIEITAVWRELDVHVLGYYLDPSNPTLAAFLLAQRADRVRRVTLMLDRLSALGLPVNYEQVIKPVAGRPPHSIGRPQVARALVAAGHAADTNDAFGRYLAEGRPAFVPRVGVEPADVVRLIVRAGGVASLAHPALLEHDELVPALVAAGMQAIEVYHPDHDEDATARYAGMARRYDLAMTGGSDYHADPAYGARLPGAVKLPREEFERLECRR